MPFFIKFAEIHLSI